MVSKRKYKTYKKKYIRRTINKNKKRTTKHVKKNKKIYRKKTLKKIKLNKKGGNTKSTATNNYKGENCAPTRSDKQEIKESCYKKGDIDYFIKEIGIEVNNNNDNEDYYRKVKDYYTDNKKCSDESCWYEKISDKKKKKKLKQRFRPRAAEKIINSNEWLTSVNILEVLRQYEKIYDNFDFIGPSPIDYNHNFNPDENVLECVTDELCKFNLEQFIESGKNKLGIVFNLDTHDKGGSHWVAMFLDLNKDEIYYFDSNGDPIPKRLKKFVKEIKKQGKKLDRSIKYKDNEGTIHQRSNSECGLYVLFFIITLLKEKDIFNKDRRMSFDDFVNERIPDTYVERLRKILFNKE